MDRGLKACAAGPAGQKCCGFGWHMFVECLAEGRGVSLPAGALAQTCVYPLDLIRRRIQMGATATAAASATVVADATWLAGLRHVIANEGFKGAFAGIVPTYAKVIPSVMITKTVADALISYGDAHGWRG